MELSCAVRESRSQRSIFEPDQAHREVRAAARPGRRLGAGEDQLLAVDADVLRAVGEAEQATGVGHAGPLPGGGLVLGEALKARLGPAALQAALGAAHHVADRVVGDHRVVRLHQQQEVAVTAPRVEVVARERGHPAQRRGRAVAEAEALVEQRRPERHRDREPAVVAIVEPQLARVRRRQRLVRYRVEAVGPPLRELGDPLGEVAEEPLEVVGHHVVRGHHPVGRARGDDAGLARAPDQGTSSEASASSPSSSREAPKAPGGDSGAPRRSLDETPAGDAAHATATTWTGRRASPARGPAARPAPRWSASPPAAGPRTAGCRAGIRRPCGACPPRRRQP